MWRPTAGVRIKWGYALAALEDLPSTWDAARGRVSIDAGPPAAQDVLVARVAELGQHTRIDLDVGRKSTLFEDDLVGVVLSPRYATRRFVAEIPDDLSTLHFVCSGGTCGIVTDVPPGLTSPTVLEPLGYLHRAEGGRVNLWDAVRRPSWDRTLACPVVVIAGSSMDSGKTTAAANLIHGLTAAGKRVAAAKLTGTASINDLALMADAGAIQVQDFTRAGVGSTAGLPQPRLDEVVGALFANAQACAPDVVVVEVADGVLQRESAIVLAGIRAAIPGAVAAFACADAVGVRRGIEELGRLGLDVAAVTGRLTASPLGIDEARREVSVPVRTSEELRRADVALALLRPARSPTELGPA